MCGISGIMGLHSRINIESEVQNVYSMLDLMEHRGPDAANVWHNGNNIVLGHRRLAIQDLSTFGEQPMLSASKKYTIVFNGEIYNFNAIRQELAYDYNFTFTGHSDTEVLVNAIELLGLEKTLAKLNGMFAFALLDNTTNIITLVQDRAAKKPLYYGFVNDRFVFSSELKTIAALPDFHKNIDKNALSLYFQKGYVPAPYAIYEGIFKLTQGSIITIDEKTIAGKDNFTPKTTQYWSPCQRAVEMSSSPFTGNFDDAKQQLNELLMDSTELRMVADVPVGVMLSGGVDSTLVSAVSKHVSTKPIKTFSLGFNGFEKSEAESAKRIAEYLKTDHEEMYIHGEDALNVVPQIYNIADEPFGDSSLIPTYLVSKLAKSQVTVALTGDGGDELFYGYKRYFSGSKIYNKLQSAPYPVRKSLSLLSGAIAKAQGPESAFEKHVAMLVSDHPLDLYNLRKDKLFNPSRIVLNGCKVNDIAYERVKSLNLDSAELNMMLYDYQTYLTDDILTKVDSASMAVSLEARNPILDKRIVEFAWSLPQEFKSENGKGKRILKALLNDYVPTELTDRPKQGFGSPLRDWLTGPLRDWADEVLNEDKLRSQGILDASFVRGLWEECMANNKKSFSRIWTILMFQNWYDNQL